MGNIHAASRGKQEWKDCIGSDKFVINCEVMEGVGLVGEVPGTKL